MLQLGAAQEPSATVLCSNHFRPLSRETSWLALQRRRPTPQICCIAPRPRRSRGGSRSAFGVSVAITADGHKEQRNGYKEQRNGRCSVTIAYDWRLCIVSAPSGAFPFHRAAAIRRLSDRRVRRHRRRKRRGRDEPVLLSVGGRRRRGLRSHGIADGNLHSHRRAERRRASSASCRSESRTVNSLGRECFGLPCLCRGTRSGCDGAFVRRSLQANVRTSARVCARGRARLRSSWRRPSRTRTR